MHVEYALSRLRDSVDHFVVPSAAPRNAEVLAAQIEFREQALKELEAIRCQFKPFARQDIRDFSQVIRHSAALDG